MNLENVLKNALSWEKYLNHIKDVIQNSSANQATQKYYPLNLARIERLLKKIKLTEEQSKRLNALDRDVILIEITEGWCGDAAQILPVVQKMVEENDKLSSVVVLRDSNSFINNYLTNGGKAIPIIVGVDKNTLEELFVWGPRPHWAHEILKAYKSGKISHEEFGLELQKMYNKDKGNTIIDEILNKLNV